MFIGNSTVSSFMVGSSPVGRLYLGTELLTRSTLDTLPMRSDLLIFQPKNATGTDLVITDEVNGVVTFSQTDANLRPIINNNLFQTGDDRFTPKGLVSSTGFTFKEMFILCNYGGGVTFDSFETLFSGTGTTGTKRIMADDQTADLISSSSIHGSGLVRLNQATESRTILPLATLKVLHTCSDFTTPVDITDANNWTIGFNSQIPQSRGWSGSDPGEYSLIGTFIFSTIALTNVERLKINDAILDAHGLL